MKYIRKRGVWIVLLILLLAIVMRLFVITASCTRIPVTSDESITVLQARQIITGDFDLFVWAQPYQFPVEAYLMAPISKFLPPNAFGARLQSFLIAFLSLAAMLMILGKMASVRQNWPAILLVLFPSAYLTMIQFGYPVPHYTSAFLFWWIAVLLAVHMPGVINRKSMAVVFLIGFFCGLAFTNNMVSLAIVLPIAIVVCAGMGLVRLCVHTPLFLAGGFFGLLPYLMGIWRYPDAQVAVAGVRPISEVVRRVWSPTLSETLPRAMGVAPGLFPDSSHTLEFGERLLPFFSGFFCLVLLYGTVLCVVRLYEQISKKIWPRLTVNEIFIGASWLGLLLFMASKRADGASFRYLTPVAWSFPFLIYYVYNGLPRRMRSIFGLLVIFLACFNFVSTQKLASAWVNPDYAVKAVSAPDLQPALDFLKQKGIKHCVASHWAAYRISFLSDEEIVCSQPHNERFPGWIVSFHKGEVDAASNVAYVLTDDIRFLKPRTFERHMRTMRVKSKKEKCGRFNVYYDFEREYGADSILVSHKTITASASSANRDAAMLTDGDMNSFWRTDRLQEKGMQVELSFSGPINLSRLMLYCGRSYNDVPRKMHVEALIFDEWQDVNYETFRRLDDFRFENGHPVYGQPSVQTLLFDRVKTDKIRIIVDEPSLNWAWTFHEIEVFKKIR